ncbi:MAG: hypothetical protein K2O70_01190 [Desulfovibrionaceae bacterium]|nr:hypothetical protein [Desulfovibrionaceae bacterium]
MTNAEIKEKQRAMAARMDAGETFYRVFSGVCPVCGREFAFPRRSGARVTCARPECRRIIQVARFLSKAGGSSPKKPDPRQWNLEERDPWFVSLGPDLCRTADPGWGF